MPYCRFQVHQIERRYWKYISSYFWGRLELWKKERFCAPIFYEKRNWSWRLKTKGSSLTQGCSRLAKAQEKGILALSLACSLEIDGEHLGWCSFYRRGARLLVATVAPPSGGSGGLCLKDTTESETGILQTPTLPTPVNNTKDFKTATTKRIIERRRIVQQKRRRRIQCRGPLYDFFGDIKPE